MLSVENDIVKIEHKGHIFNAKAGKTNDEKNHRFTIGDEVIMFIRPESIFIKDQNNSLDNNFTAKLNTVEFEGNLKNIYLKMNSETDVRFSVPNAIDTSDLSKGKNIELTFSSSKAIVLPKGILAVD